MTLTPEQEHAVLLLMSGIRVCEHHPLVPVIFGLRDELITRARTRAWVGALVDEVAA